MSKKSFVVILVIGIVVTYLLPYVNLFLPVNSGKYGFPLEYGTSSFFGGSSFNFTYFLIDTIFWFLVILFTWKLFKRVSKL